MHLPISVEENYDKYFASSLYDKRYPHPNPSTFAVIAGEIGTQGKRVLDIGCGNGRYAESLLGLTDAMIVACDISREAIDELTIRCSGHVASGRLRPVFGDLSVVAKTVKRNEKFDLAIMVFGVLGHIYSRALRRQALASICSLLRPGGRIVVTVPNAARRFPRQQRAAQSLVRAGDLEAGDIFYERTSNDLVVKMYYHLYTLEEFAQDLEQQGFRLIHLGAESFLPESGVVRSTLLRGVDRFLATFVPLRHAYGFLAVAEVAGEADKTARRPHPPASGRPE
jgi:SAM-dependent methyltransferase